MNTSQRKVRYGSGVLLCLAMSASNAVADNYFRSTDQAGFGANILAVSPGTFEEDWAVIDAFITTHAIITDPCVRSQIRDETYNRVHNWQCVGTGLGYPLNFAAGFIYFDTSENADTCAEMILELANR